MKKHWLLTLCLSWLLAFALSKKTLAQDTQELTHPQVPLEQLLNRDGTLDLNRNFRGSLDPTGWQMMDGPNGEPRFVPASATQQTAGAQLIAVPGDENWDDRFGLPGLNSTVRAIAVSGGEAYVGGYFTIAGGAAANYIAKWDGTSWSALGSGINNVVFTIAVSGGEVYAGGAFTIAGGVSANNIAKWDGTNWSALGSGMNNSVYTIAVSGSEVYAGGSFTIAGDLAANRIAKWDGTSWSALGSGMNDAVLDLAVNGGEVYAGGSFTMAGGVAANRIAKWDGASWLALGSGMNSTVWAIATAGGEVYAGGWFTTAGGAPANHIAKWDGTSWSALDSGLNDGVLAIAVSGGEVYAGGYFTTAGDHIAKWDGTSWSALGSGMNSYVYALTVNGGEVFAGGDFTAAGGVAANRIAKWDGANWFGLHTANRNGVNAYVHAIAVSGGEVYVGGYLTTAGGVVANHIAKWDGTSWSALGSGINGDVWAIAVSGSDVYAGGTFTTVGGVVVNHIAKWDGSSWSALGSGVLYGGAFDIDGRYLPAVSAITVSGSDVYLGGAFTAAGGVAANRVAKWDGSSWSALGSGVNWFVTSIAASGSDVYVGGAFTMAGGMGANYIAKWDGSSWSALGSGVYSRVYAMAASGSDVYASGYFFTADGVGSYGIGKWDGSSWSVLGSGMNSLVYAIAVSGGEVELYAGGYFTIAGGAAANYIAKWDGATWSALGGGMNYPVWALAVNGGEVYAGGGFTTAGGKPSSYFGKYFSNAPPMVTADGPYSVDEGRSVTVTASGNDPENGPLTYAWDLDNNGSFETPGQSVNFSAANFDGPSNRTIQVQVTDNGGLTATAQATVNVLNVAPTASFANLSGTIIAGQSATLAFSNQTDPSAADVTAGFTYSCDCTNDGTFEIVDVAAASHVCAYPVSGTFTAKGLIKDKDGDFTDYTVEIVVLPALVANAGADQQICDGKSVPIGGNLAASGGTPPYTYSWAPSTTLNNPAAANPNASPAVTTIYTLTVTDANGLADANEMTVIVKGTCKPVAFLANKVTLKSTKQSTCSGDIHSNGALTVEKGDPSIYNSNLTAVGKITIQKENTINGKVTSPLAISNSGTINGTIIVGPVANIPLPSKSYSAGGLNKTVPSGGSLALAPGSYGIVTLNGGGTLKLASGDYFFTELRYPGSTAVIEIDVSSGNAANVNVVSTLQFGKEVALRLLPNGESDSELVTFFTLQSTAVNIGKQAYFLGTLNAPNATVTLVKNSQLRGSICAKEILVERDCLFLHHDSPGSLPGPGNLPKSFDDEEVISDQSPVTSYELAQNYPNPFNPSTMISFQLPAASEVSLAIYNSAGQLVRTLIASEMNAGRHSVVWDAREEHGRQVASGVYMCFFKAGEFTAQRKLVLMK